jgi:hypothetical protein
VTCVHDDTFIGAMQLVGRASGVLLHIVFWHCVMVLLCLVVPTAAETCRRVCLCFVEVVSVFSVYLYFEILSSSI